jgi:hypothetical protein
VTAARAALLETVRDGDHLGVEAIASGGAIAWAISPFKSCVRPSARSPRRDSYAASNRAGSPARFEGRVVSSLTSTARSASPPTPWRAWGGTPTCLTESDDHGFSIDEAEVIYWGLCPDCSTARSS